MLKRLGYRRLTASQQPLPLKQGPIERTNAEDLTRASRGHRPSLRSLLAVEGSAGAPGCVGSIWLDVFDEPGLLHNPLDPLIDVRVRRQVEPRLGRAVRISEDRHVGDSVTITHEKLAVVHVAVE